MKLKSARAMPIGAEPGPGGASARVWAPAARRVELVAEPSGARFALEPEPGGYHSGWVPGLAPGALYRYSLDGAAPLPDPASRFQPDGPHGASELVDPQFGWSDSGWRGLSARGQVLYELHVGSFTKEGTFAAAARRLDALRELGVTAVELMPVAEFPGRFGWGYDGVDLFAPTRLYGRPDELRRLVDRAHALGLGVLLDVVYNHLGPDGNYLARYAPRYFDARRRTDWGPTLNFDGPDSGPVREFVAENAAYWVREFHLDGLRLDATQNIYDEGPRHVLAELAARARAAAGARGILLCAENEPQEPCLFESFGLDMAWNDDFHHAARVALTGSREAYFRDYRGTPQELISASRRGWLFQGQWYAWQGKRRGKPSAGIAPERFVCYLENHDQVSNGSLGARRLRELSSPGRARAATTLLLLGPATPLLFQSQESERASPFFFFADHEPRLRESISSGRRGFLAQFPSMAGPDAQACVPDPADPRTLERCRAAETERGPVWTLHADLLRLRREDPAFSAQSPSLEGAVLGERAFALRFSGPRGEDRLLVVNLGHELELEGLAEPLLAPPAGRRWAQLWSSEEPRYGGGGAVPLDERRWRLQPECAFVLAPGGEP